MVQFLQYTVYIYNLVEHGVSLKWTRVCEADESDAEQQTIPTV